MPNRYLFWLWVMIFCGTAQAQDPDTVTYRLSAEKILEKAGARSIEDLLDVSVVTTSRVSDQKSGKAAATVVIVTAEQIAARGYQSLLDVLYDLPEVKIDYGVDPRWMNEISVRGIRGMDRFVILLDGVRISSPTNDVIPVMENYPVHLARQIEVVYGPASALYGADAFTGVINIITKKEEDAPRPQVSLMGGMYQSLTANLYAVRRLGPQSSLTVGGQYFYDRQPELHHHYPREYQGLYEGLKNNEFATVFGPMRSSAVVSPVPGQEPLAARALYASLKVRHLTISLFHNRSVNPATLAQKPTNAVYNRGIFFGHAVSMANAVYNREFGRWKSSTFLVGSRYDLDPESSFRNVYTAMNPAYLYSYGWMLKAEQLVSARLHEQVNLTLGATYEKFFSIPRGHDLQYPVYGPHPEAPIVNSIFPLNPQGIAADFARVDFTNAGALAELRYTPLPSLSLTVGSRYDHNSRFGSTFNPRAGVVWEITPKVSVKGLFGSAFLAPSPLATYDQFGTFFSTDNGQTLQSAFFRLPNPNLKPQTIRTGELGLNVFLTRQLRVQATGFYSAISGLFNYVSDAGNTNLYNGQYKGWPVSYIEVNINQGEQRNYGGTAELNYFRQWTERKKITAYLSLSYVQGEVVDGGKSVQVPALTPFMLKVGGEWFWNKWSLSPRLILCGRQGTFTPSPQNPAIRQTLPGFALVNVTANYRFNNYTSLFLVVKNALDARYHHVNLGAAPEGAGAGAAQAEFEQGTPQNPIRLYLGLNMRF